MNAYLSEIFSSIQGEGPHLGERHLFLRFCGCHRSCVYCDTPLEKTESVRVERAPGSGRFEYVPNPVSADRLLEMVRDLDPENENRRVAVTGGEPLLQSGFLARLLPELVADGRSVYLETAGDLPDRLEPLIRWIDVVAMDVKLSSVTKEENAFSGHWKFIGICRAADVEVFAKLVLSSETDEDELMAAAKGIRSAGGQGMPVVLQPMTRAGKTDAVPTGAQLLRWHSMLRQVLSDVRVIPQTHLMMEVL